MSGRATTSAAAWRLPIPLLLAILAFLIGFLPEQGRAQSSPAEVFGVRFGVNENITRIVLDIDAATRFATRALDSPPRLVIELENVRWQVRSHPQGRPLGLARAVNYGNLDAGRGRLVIDIDRPFRILRQDRLPPSADARHHRIVVDIVPFEPTTAPPATSVAEAEPPGPAEATPEPPSEPRRDTERQAAARTADASRPPIAGPPLARPAATALGRTIEPEPAPEPESGPTETPEVTELPLPGTNHHQPPPVGGLEDGSEGETTLAALPIRPSPAPPARRRIIALDPGHGGVDPGTVGINGVLEKEVTLDLAQRLRSLIEATGRYSVVLTREADVFVSLRDRMETARRADASLFISIHADSLGDSRFRGASVYTLSDDASDSEAARLARKENRADIIAGTDLSAHDQTVASILIDLAQRVTNNKSIEFADVLTSELADVTALVRNTRRFAGFVVLKSPDVPSVLLELGYLSNPTDAANLARPEYRDKLAKATLRAIDRYFAGLDASL